MKFLRREFILSLILIYSVGCALRPTPEAKKVTSTPPRVTVSENKIPDAPSSEATAALRIETAKVTTDVVTSKTIPKPEVRTAEVTALVYPSRAVAKPSERDPVTPNPSDPDPVTPKPSAPTSAAPKPVQQNKVQPNLPTDIPSLARALVREARDDREKAYALYRWLGENIAYDAEAYFANKYPKQDAESVLKRKTAVCAGYAELFTALGNEVGLQSEVISGHSKGYSFSAGTKNLGDANHAWNAVKINGEWRLLDSTWGAGHISKQKTFVRKPNDEWFLLGPEAFIYTHLPEEQKWQLLSQPVSTEKFLSMPKLRPPFFSSGLHLESPQKDGSVCKSRTQLRVSSRLGAIVSARLKRTDQDGYLPDTTFITTDRQESRIDVRFPDPGEYELVLFSRMSNNAEWEHAGSVRFQAEEGEHTPFPTIYREFWDGQITLLDGFDGKLNAGRSASIALRAPHAEGVHAVQGHEWTSFKKSGDSYSLEVTPEPGELMIVTERVGQNPGILKYEVQ